MEHRDRCGGGDVKELEVLKAVQTGRSEPWARFLCAFHTWRIIAIGQ
jgi:hypothetical protein